MNSFTLSLITESGREVQQTINVQDGDRLIVHMPENESASDLSVVLRVLDQWLKGEVAVLVLPHGWSLEVLSIGGDAS